jgi:hypothetical protein
MALVAGPIMMLKPKPAQRQKEELRLKARALGIHFSMLRLPQLKTAQEVPNACPVYSFPPSTKLAGSKGWVLLRTSYTHESNFYEVWDWYEKRQPSDSLKHILQPYMPLLPASVEAISAGSQGVCVFWREQGGEGCLNLIHKILLDLAEATSS